MRDRDFIFAKPEFDSDSDHDDEVLDTTDIQLLEEGLGTSKQPSSSNSTYFSRLLIYFKNYK
jgi:hypothetical protein